MLGSVWHALGSRITPQGTPRSRSALVAMTILVLWLIARLWPLLPDPGLRQLKRAVRPLLTPHIDWMALAGFFVGWLVVAQAVFHLANRQRAVDVFLIVIAIVLVGRTFIAGSTLDVRGDRGDRPAAAGAGAAEPARGRRRARRWSRCCSARWLAWSGAAPAARRPAPGRARAAGGRASSCCATCRRRRSSPARAFSYVSLGWLLAGAGLFRTWRPGMTICSCCC